MAPYFFYEDRKFMSICIGINGFGRIGRSIVRALYESDKFSRNITLVAINEIADTASMAGVSVEI